MKQSTIRAAQDDKDPYRFVITSEAVDSYGTIFQSDGWDLRRFKANPVALFNHNHDNIVGTWNNIERVGKKILMTFVPAEAGTSPMVDMVRKLVEQKILRGASVGVIPKKSVFDPKKGVMIFTESELIEASIVSVPSNPEALSVARNFGMSAELETMLFTARSEFAGIHAVRKRRIELAKMSGVYK